MLRKLEGFAANAFNVFFAGALNLFFEISRPKEKKRKRERRTEDTVEELTESPNDMF